MNDIVSEIKSRLPIEDIVKQYVHLKQAGRNLKGLCPFHQEKTPSFMVSPEKQLAYCFGCHKGGDIFAFIQEVEGVDFKDAVKILADKAGIDISEYSFNAESGQSKSEKDELYEIHRKTQSVYTKLLWESEKGQKVLGYLQKRGLKDETIKKFGFGYSPDSFDETYMKLVKDGHSRKTIALSGVAIAKDTQGHKIYDRFRNRLMVPIYDGLSRIVGFGGRALKKDDEPKYLNSPDSPIYRKSEVLYGLNYAKNSIKKTDSAILVEGYFDVVMAHQAGTENVCATSGTALTDKQIRLLKRFTKNLVFCFDNDSAGIDAAKRAFEIAQNEDMNVHVCTLPDAKDPADYIKDNEEKWPEAITKTVPFMQFCISESVNRHDIAKVEGKKKVLSEVLPYLFIVNNSIDRDYYVREIAQKLDLKEIQVYDELKRIKKSDYNNPSENKENSNETNKKFTSSDVIFGLLYEYPEVLDDEFKDLKPEYFDDEEKSIYNIYKDNYNLLRAEDSREDFLSCFDPELRKKIEVISLYTEKNYGNFNEKMVKNEFKALADHIKEIRDERTVRSLTREIREAEKNGENEKAKELLKKLNELVSS